MIFALLAISRILVRSKPLSRKSSNAVRFIFSSVDIKLGAKVLIEHKENGAGKLVITYTSLEELDGILGQIK